MAAEIFTNVLNVGEAMMTALENEDIDAYLALLQERGTLLDAILSYRHPSDIDVNWMESAEALSSQHAALIEAAEAQHRRMQDALTRLEQIKGAHRSYHQPIGQRTILNENLRV